MEITDVVALGILLAKAEIEAKRHNISVDAFKPMTSCT